MQRFFFFSYSMERKNPAWRYYWIDFPPLLFVSLLFRQQGNEEFVWFFLFSCDRWLAGFSVIGLGMGGSIVSWMEVKETFSSHIHESIRGAYFRFLVVSCLNRARMRVSTRVCSDAENT